MKKLIAIAVAVALATSGCAGVVRPSVDSGKPLLRPVVDLAAGTTPPNLFEKDLYECNQFAVQVDRDKAAVNGAAAGAVIGTILGAALGLRGNNLVAVAAYGAAAGGAHNAVASDYANLNEYQVVQRCLSGRGYSVIR